MELTTDTTVVDDSTATTDLAAILGDFRDALVSNGFDDDEAFELTETYFVTLLRRAERKAELDDIYGELHSTHSADVSDLLDAVTE